MIVPMKKVTLVVLDREREDALKALRKTGVLHIEKQEAQSETLEKLTSTLADAEQALAVLGEYAGKNTGKSSSHSGDTNNASEIVEQVLQLREERKEAYEIMARTGRELDRFALWGDIDPTDFDYFAEKGIYFFPFEMSVDDYTAIPESVRSIIVNRDKKNIRCLIWGEDDLLHAGMPPGAREIVLPEKSTVELRSDFETAQARIPKIDAELTTLAASIPVVAAYIDALRYEKEFETVRAGMEAVAVTENGNHPADLAALCGYLPTEKAPAISKAAAKNGWACLITDPDDEDAVPTELKNNRFVNLIKPLMDFLGTVPGYREVDISLWFLLFFGIFFAMIFGDAGYGAILAGISLWGIFSARGKGTTPPPALSMMVYLALMTMAWGTITCTWFGIPVEHLPDFFKTIALPAFSNENPTAPDNIKVFCFTLGLVQISVAHLIGIVRNRTSLKALGELGSLMMTVGMYFVVLNLVVSAEKYPLSDIILGSIGAGFLLNFIFINFEGAIGKGILESLKNIITMCLGVVNMFGDIMSYIRLWAVGLAGAAISATVNEMAGPFLGGFIIFAGVLLLVFGHGLNYVMNALSVIVHGVRLNTLEFSNHLGLTWSGFKYEPFSETGNK
ncbi:MAG TPA: V-type ATPase 116kDa subunit family protein [Treponemataceae bacterium]|nr:MAG: V-type ATP synthase subunit I [Spirochaetes bacterium ADurb.Bin215]HPX14844.1 V-type ATPase 116kDa subunit family protein [Treponemataceae bacterium]HQB88907.1 V-type ATPase 116kDa subunit family protein [Treponemataceae bacterium]